MTVFRHIILIFILCFDIAVTAGTPADAKNSICNSIINIEVKSMCAYQADQSKYFDNNATNEFRADLYYRLNVINVETPSLFERLDDFEELLYQFSKNMKVRFSHSAIQRMKKHPWPGNIRELKNTVSRASALFPQQLVEEADVEMILDKLTPAPDGSGIPLNPLPIIKEMKLIK
jgi:DNA-binding NtrC family response regulator